MAVSVVQSASNRTATGGAFTVVVTLGAAPTIGNLLVAHLVCSSDNDNIESLNNGTWTKIAKVYSGNLTNWPNMLYYQKVSTSLSAATTYSSNKNAFREFSLIELDGVDAFDRFISTNNSSTTSGSISPIAGKAVALIAAVADRDTTPPPQSRANPVAGQTIYTPTTMASMVTLHRLVDPSSGSYTIGTTGAGGNSSFIGASFYSQPQTPTSGSIIGLARAARDRWSQRRTIFVPDPVGYSRRPSGLLTPV